MLRLSLLAAAIAGCSAFTAPSPMALRQGASGVTMQMDRRAVAQGIAAGILGIPAASFAASGDFPKQAFFGDAPISAPFGDTYGTAGAPIWDKMGEVEKGIFTRIATETKKKLEQTSDLVDEASWQLARAEIRGVMGESRKSMLRLTEESGNPDAKKSFESFKRKLNALDLGLSQKAPNSAALMSATKVEFNQWLITVGLAELSN